MRPTPAILIGALLLVTQPSALIAAPRESDAYHIVLPRRALSAGERVELKLEPPAPAGVRVRWSVVSGTADLGLEPPIYRAPFVVLAGTPPVKVSATLSGTKTSVTTEISLVPSSLPGAADCLGPGQTYSTVLGAIEPGYTYAEVLPELISRVEPEHPRSALARGVDDTLPVSVLVCTSGRVLDAYLVANYRDPRDLEPIEHDPKLVASALTAARQFVFKPAMASGQAIAVWVHVPISFRR